MARKSQRGCPLDSLVPCQFRLVFGQGIQSFFSVSLSVLRKYFLKFIGNNFLWRRLLAYSVTTTGQGALMAATSSHQEQCLRTASDADDGGNEDSNHSRERVCARQPGNWRALGERGSLGGGGGWEGKNCLDLLWEKGEKRSRYCMLVCVGVCVCVCVLSTVFFFLSFFFFDFLQQFFLTFCPDCGFIL